MGKKMKTKKGVLKAVPNLAVPKPGPVVPLAPGDDPLLKQPPKPEVRICPAPAKDIIQRRIEAVQLARKQLQETVDTVAAGLGIDHTKEKWDYNAEQGLFTRVR